ncbi:MAG TPA: diguanylate cyclase [Solirubrobacteraceae bacterium]|nr:diguanylate cyclase [Solirubrobacteraceae bacterium]
MSFRNRLGLFFVLIVIVPMVAVAFMLFGLLGKSERLMGAADVAARERVSLQVFNSERDKADRLLEVVGKDAIFGAAVQSRDLGRAERRARQLLRSRGIERIVFLKGEGVALKVGDRSAVAARVLPLQIRTASDVRKTLGVLAVSVIDARTYARRVNKLTGLEVVVRNGGKVLATTFPNGRAPRTPVDDRERAHVGDESYEVEVFGSDAGFPGQKISVTTFGTPNVSASAAYSRAKIGAILAGFLLLALVCAVLVSRSLQQQLAAFLDAARRLAGGDFSAKVTTVGKDEFAGLGEEFNKMSGELENKLVELRQERERVQHSMRRLGDAVASKLDRDALLEIVVGATVEGVGADAGRAHVRGPDRVTLQERASTGNMNGLGDAVRAVEADALRWGRPAEMSGEHANAMAHPLRGTNSDANALGVVSVGRSGRSFTQSERELFHYMAGQAARSMESVDSFESVSHASVTDYLTELKNRRAFDDALDREVVRARRSGALGLVLIDIDDFKAINTNYLWTQGDRVLREVGRVLRESSREIDHPARYGGEELALILPGTDLEGAFRVAERVREQIAALRIPMLDGTGSLQVTVSCGVAAVPNTPADKSALLVAVAQALREAKATGKNKTVRAR